MISDVEALYRDWNEYAHLDPLWAICSAPGRKNNQWDLHAFFETGRQQIELIFQHLQRLAISPHDGAALDFGCGVGRLTQALAKKFRVCYGVDISPKMIEMAQQYNQVESRCQYVLNTQDNLSLFSDQFFDFIFTFIVLQHLPPDLMQKYLREFGRILAMGGVLVFQVPIQILTPNENPFHRLPIYHPVRILNKLRWEFRQLLNKFIGDEQTRFYRLSKLGISKRWLYHIGGIHPPVHMYYLEESVIQQLLKEMGLTIVEVIKDTEKEPGMLNALFIVSKPVSS